MSLNDGSTQKQRQREELQQLIATFHGPVIREGGGLAWSAAAVVITGGYPAPRQRRARNDFDCDFATAPECPLIRLVLDWSRWASSERIGERGPRWGSR
jgi:hypothetical protein